MLAAAEATGVDLNHLEATRRRLAAHEAKYDRALVGTSARNELEQLIAADVAELAAAYKRLARMVERMPSA
jgi:hypothetical protein